MEVGRKQLALLLLLSNYEAVTVTEVQNLLRIGTYKSIQSSLNRLVEKELVATAKRGHKLLYTLTDEVISSKLKPFEELMNCSCSSLELIRALYS